MVHTKMRVSLTLREKKMVTGFHFCSFMQETTLENYNLAQIGINNGSFLACKTRDCVKFSPCSASVNVRVYVLLYSKHDILNV